MSTAHGQSTKQELLQLLLQRGEATAQALAEQLSISPQAVRRHLRDLEDEGLIRIDSQADGPGRPQLHYRLTASGRQRFPDAYDRFALGLLESLTASLPPEAVQSVLQHQWQRQAEDYRRQLGQAPITERLQQLVDLRRSEGYMSDWFPAGADEADGFVITEYNCAIASIAEQHPRICDYELELFRASLPDCQVERTHWLIDGEHRCGYRVRQTPVLEQHSPKGSYPPG